MRPVFVAVAVALPAAASDDLLRQDDPGPSISFWTQARYTANVRDVEGPAEPFTHGFSLRRTRLTVSGDTGDLSYKLTASFSRRTGAARVSDAYVAHAFGDSVSLRIGQFKAPLLKEELTSAKRLLAADRSLSNSIFTLSRVQGIATDIEADRYRLTVMLHDGADGANTDFDESIADVAIAVRDELLLWGSSFDAFRQATSPRGTSPAGVLGGALDYELLNDAIFDHQVTATIDFDIKADGWGAMVAGMFRHQWGGADALTDWALLAQGGLYLDEKTELFGRAEVILADADRPADDAFPVFTIGANRYILGQALKATADVQYAPVATTDNSLVGAASGLGLLESDGSQVVLRLQLQAVF